jgi:Ca-activated chloride channel homolog
MRQSSVTGFLCALAVCLATAVPASAAGPTTRTVYVTVVDDRGQPVPGLTPADFAVKESGKEREIASVAPASEKMRLALMVELPLAAQASVRVGLAEFVTRMCPAAEISLILVTLRNEKIVDFTSDQDALLDGIRNLPLSQPRWTAAVPDGLYEIAKSFEKTKPARPVIVLATVEHSQSTELDPEGILSQIAKSKAQFWAVSIQPAGSGSAGKVNSIRDFAGRSQVIGDGSLQSGGRRVEVMVLTSFQRGLQQVADDLSSQYLIIYTLPDGVRASDRISVSLKKPGATLRAPNRVPNK